MYQTKASEHFKNITIIATRNETDSSIIHIRNTMTTIVNVSDSGLVCIEVSVNATLLAKPCPPRPSSFSIVNMPLLLHEEQ